MIVDEIIVVGVAVAATAAVIRGLDCFPSRFPSTSVNRRWRHAPGLGAFHIYDFVIDFVFGFEAPAGMLMPVNLPEDVGLLRVGDKVP